MSGQEEDNPKEIEGEVLEQALNIETVAELKREKAAKKTVFTKVRRCLLTIIQREDVDSQEIKDICEELDIALENVMSAMDKLFDRYKIEKDNRAAERLGDEIEQIEFEYSSAQNRAQKIMDSLSLSRKYDKFLDKIQQKEAEIPLHQMEFEQPHQKEVLQQQQSVQQKNPQELLSVSMNDNVSQYTSDSTLIGLDLWKQLKRVTIPVFTDDKKTYQSWKAAFTACVDNAPATAEYKLLQLRQSLAGEALRTIENLGHSAIAYHTAKERLERKFGGHRRQIALYLEEVDNFRPICPGNYKEIEKFADLLDITIVNLKEANRSEELKDGLLYLKLQKKLPTSMLSSYHRWIFEKQKRESVESLREWVLQEAEFQTKALEAVHGLTNTRQGKSEMRKFKRDNPHTFYGRADFGTERQQLRVCKVCSKSHGAWACPEFKQMEIQSRWDCAKQNKLCFRCLGDRHLGQFCNRTRVCGIDGCKEIHHRLLHKVRSVLPGGHSRGMEGKKKEELPPVNKQDDSANESSHGNGGESKDQKGQQKDHLNDTYTTVTQPGTVQASGTIALRTIPVYLKNGTKRIKVNALLDDASTKTYINSDVAAELGVHGQLQKVNVSVLNGHVETFETSPVECMIESLDGKSKLRITAFTTERVIGDTKAIDWSMCAREWSHLRQLKFPKLGP